MVRKNDYIQEVDYYIGKEIYSLRLAHGLSLQQLSQEMGVTHQQLRKYEKGINRISAGRLVLIAKALSKDVAFFYKNIDSTNKEPMRTGHQRMCIEVSRNFMRITNSSHQEAVNILVNSLSKIA